MTSWTVTHGDILDVEAEVLVCSANPFLTLSGGVGGAFLLRYGEAMQEALRAYLAERDVRHVPQGALVRMDPCGSPYRAVLHAVAVDGMYASSPEVITRLVERIIEDVHAIGARTVALPALACGYGRLTIEQFAEGLRPLVDMASQPVEVRVCLKREEDAVRVREILSLKPR